MNMWHERFKVNEYVYGKEPNEFIRTAAPFIKKGGQVLSIAEGEGRNAVFLAGEKFIVNTWDYAQSGIDKTEKLAIEKGVVVNMELRDLADVEWPENKWDAIIHVFGHFPEPIFNRTMKGIKKAIKPGGLYIAELFTTDQLRFKSGGPRAIDMLCTPTQIMKEFDGWYSKHFFTGEAERNEGRLHQGTSHVIQCVLQKPQ
ncbi:MULTISPECIES: class I SAM-dependent methyltransferase [Bacillaceae]|uniref:Tellurite resistance methyltransferase TehB n=1 Tax=Domibacillus aminovorans TaxID=29332 RepID=A0A177KIN1_9BACI|nr:MULTISPECIES: class I SAM-dependent methyltransferase [Bacillaceae]OAH53229.1 tellurite resistance methyltransferase TehB [Domibacillus aminovorans]